MNRALWPALPLATLALLLSALLAACGGVLPDTTPPNVTISSQTISCSASYNLVGTATDNVAVTAASYTLNAGGSQTVNLSSGSFDVPITLQAGSNTFDVTATDAAGNTTTKTITVTYTPPAPGTGSLSITINPPATVAGSVDVTGCNYSQAVSATTTLTGLNTGTYDITPQTVQDTNYDYQGTATQGGTPVTQVDVVANQTTSVIVDYQASDGALAITWSGQTLPGNYEATVTDANGATVTVTAPSRSNSSTTIPYLAPGAATITPTNFPTGCTVKVNQPPTIVAGNTASATVVYKCN